MCLQLHCIQSYDFYLSILFPSSAINQNQFIYRLVLMIDDRLVINYKYQSIN